MAKALNNLSPTRVPLVWAIFFQLTLAAFSAPAVTETLSGTIMWTAWRSSMVAYWLLFGWLWFRVRKHLSATHGRFVAFGYPVTYCIAVVIYILVLKLRGNAILS
jgi:hypothetical protein